MKSDDGGWSVQLMRPATFEHHDTTGLLTDTGQPTAGQLICFKPTDPSGYQISLCLLLTAG